MMSSDVLRAGPRYVSVLVELLREGTDPAGILSTDTRYILAIDDSPVTEMRLPIGHVNFLDRLEELDYRREPATRIAALEALSDVASTVLRQARIQLPEGPVQLDLVVSAAELAALPFELAKGEDGRPLFARSDREVEVTRRVRFGFARSSTRWRAKPRILFVSASPRGVGDPVPRDANKDELCSALRPWVEPLTGHPQAIPDERTVLKVLDEASLTAIRRACEDAIDERAPFTHVHVLAHGHPIGSRHHEHFGVALHGEDGGLKPAGPKELAEALRPIAESCSVVTLAVCHGGDHSNTILPGASLAHELHAAGIPVVIGAQFPLTFTGSRIFVERFYGALLKGEDVRAALHDARVALSARQAETGHDWASLVGYVRLPENYADHLIDVSLESDLASLRTAQCWSDHIIEHGVTAASAFGNVARHLQERIQHLEVRLDQAAKCGRQGVLEENRGLLGSAEKRLAEVHFHLWQNEHRDERKQAMLEALGRSRRWYHAAYRGNLSHHWTGVQTLSLAAVLDGRIDQPALWYPALAAAQLAMEDEKDYWAAGSVAELHLLAPAAGQARAIEKAAEALRELKARTERYRPDAFPIESTLRQLRRYSEWWTDENGFFPNSSDLAADARALIPMIEGCSRPAVPA